MSAGLVIDGELVAGSGAEVATWDPATGAQVGAFTAASPSQLAEVAAAAAAAEDAFRRSSPATRADLLEGIATRLEAAGDDITAVAGRESGLGPERLSGELARTNGQLRMFANGLRAGELGHARDDETGGPASVPLRLRSVAIGPVAVFAASNFPLAFSTAGGDVAAALAAGCPVVVKAHSAHVATSVRVATEIAAAVRESGLPGGVFGHLVGGREIGVALVEHPVVRAVGFTGSRAGGLALVRAAAARPVPIPVFAEMSAVNPVLVLPGAASEEVADGFVASLTLGAGQFCTNPGLVFIPSGELGDRFASRAAEAVSATPGQTMLTRTIGDAYDEAVDRTRQRGARVVAAGTGDPARNARAPQLLEVELAAFLADPAWMDEMFGAAALLVRYADADELPAAADALEGQLTATVWHSPGDAAQVAALLPVLERKAGRLISNGWPTGVAVSPAMVHGGPYPATTDARFTAVGTLAVERFLRPVAYQGFADDVVAPLT